VPDGVGSGNGGEDFSQGVDVNFGVFSSIPFVNAEIIFSGGIHHPEFNVESGESTPEWGSEDASSLKQVMKQG
jgi:hypothetical protein